MSTEPGDRLVADYLERLERAGTGLPAGVRADLVTEIRGHIADARAADGADGGDDEVGVRTVLDRLGEPEEIVAAAGGEAEPAPLSRSLTSGSSRSVTRETWAVLFLTAGSVLLPGVGWLVGVVLLWSSDLWRNREKWLGTLVVPGGVGVIWAFAIFGFTAGGSVESCFASSTVDPATGATAAPPVDTCSSTAGDSSWTPWLVLPGFALVTLAALIVPLFLLGVVRRRAEQQSRPGSPAVVGV